MDDCLCCASLNRISGSVISHKFYVSVDLARFPPARPWSLPRPQPQPQQWQTPVQVQPLLSAPSRLIMFIKIYVAWICLDKKLQNIVVATRTCHIYKRDFTWHPCLRADIPVSEQTSSSQPGYPLASPFQARHPLPMIIFSWGRDTQNFAGMPGDTRGYLYMCWLVEGIN